MKLFCLKNVFYLEKAFIWKKITFLKKKLKKAIWSKKNFFERKKKFTKVNLNVRV